MRINEGHKELLLIIIILVVSLTMAYFLCSTDSCMFENTLGFLGALQTGISPNKVDMDEDIYKITEIEPATIKRLIKEDEENSLITCLELVSEKGKVLEVGIPTKHMNKTFDEKRFKVGDFVEISAISRSIYSDDYDYWILKRADIRKIDNRNDR